jgi:hypothetical protein
MAISNITVEHLKEIVEELKNSPFGRILKNVRVQEKWFERVGRGRPGWESVEFVLSMEFDGKITEYYGIDCSLDPFAIIGQYSEDNGLLRDCGDRGDIILATILFWQRDGRVLKVLPHIAKELKMHFIANNDPMGQSEDWWHENDAEWKDLHRQFDETKSEYIKLRALLEYVRGVNNGHLPIIFSICDLISYKEKHHFEFPKINDSYDYLFDTPTRAFSAKGIMDMNLGRKVEMLGDRMTVLETRINEMRPSIEGALETERLDEEECEKLLANSANMRIEVMCLARKSLADICAEIDNMCPDWRTDPDDYRLKGRLIEIVEKKHPDVDRYSFYDIPPAYEEFVLEYTAPPPQEEKITSKVQDSNDDSSDDGQSIAEFENELISKCLSNLSGMFSSKKPLPEIMDKINEWCSEWKTDDFERRLRESLMDVMRDAISELAPSQHICTNPKCDGEKSPLQILPHHEMVCSECKTMLCDLCRIVVDDRHDCSNWCEEHSAEACVCYQKISCVKKMTSVCGKCFYSE